MKHQPDANYPLALRDEAVSFDPEQFDNLVREQGVTFIHYRAMACPLGMVDPDDERHPHELHSECSNGFIYTLAGKVTCGFVGNTKESRLTDLGRLDGSSANIVFPRYYDQEHATSPLVPIEIAPFDRLFLDENVITVPTWQVFAADPSGRDKVEFPVASVTDLIDARGVRYTSDDFAVVNGIIVWGAKHPGIDAKSGKGIVCTVRYQYKPHWYIERLLHEVRVAPVANPLTGEREIVRFNQSASIQREYFFRKDQPGRVNNPRAIASPTATGGTVVPDGGYGPR
jgi:hypothetical protein